MCNYCREDLGVEFTKADEIIEALIDYGLHADHDTDSYEHWRKKVTEILRPKPLFASAEEYLADSARKDGLVDDDEDDLPKTREELMKGVTSK